MLLYTEWSAGYVKEPDIIWSMCFKPQTVLFDIAYCLLIDWHLCFVVSTAHSTLSVYTHITQYLSLNFKVSWIEHNTYRNWN